MTCDAARDQLSAFLDNALADPARRALDAHLAQCAECRRELDQLRATVALLRRFPPVHAPAGFVDRVLAEAARPPWPRRLLDGLFRPLRVKLPLEAAAVLLVAGSALYVYEHAPELKQLTRPETTQEAPPVPNAAPPRSSTASDAGIPATGLAERTEPLQDKASEAPSAPAEQQTAREEATPQIPPAVAPPETLNRSVPGTPGASRLEAPAAQSEAKREARPDAKAEVQSGIKKEVQGERPPNGPEKVARVAEPSPPRDATGSRAPGAASPAEKALPQTMAPAAVPEAHGRAGGVGSAPSPAPAPEGAAGDTLSAAKPRTAARLMRASDASGRLVVPAREPAEVALDALLTRLGATRVARWLDHPQGPVLIDVVVPAARYGELLEGLGHIGRWTTEHEPKTLPARVRVEVAVTVAP
jgi:hypothetical protein